jgi:hypothetical protein
MADPPIPPPPAPSAAATPASALAYPAPSPPVPTHPSPLGSAAPSPGHQPLPQSPPAPEYAPHTVSRLPPPPTAIPTTRVQVFGHRGIPHHVTANLLRDHLGTDMNFPLPATSWASWSAHLPTVLWDAARGGQDTVVLQTSLGRQITVTSDMTRKAQSANLSEPPYKRNRPLRGSPAPPRPPAPTAQPPASPPALWDYLRMPFPLPPPQAPARSNADRAPDAPRNSRTSRRSRSPTRTRPSARHRSRSRSRSQSPGRPHHLTAGPQDIPDPRPTSATVRGVPGGRQGPY